MPEAFKFPDELEKNTPLDIEVQTEEDDIDLEVVDDTPQEDRGRKPLDREISDPTDEEVAEYSEKVQKRMKELTHARHDERRAKESALREREEASRIAAQLLEENRKLREQFNAGAASYTQVVQSQAEVELQMARQKLRAAQESYDNEQIIAAQEELAAAKFKAEAAKNYRPPTLQQPEKDVYVTPTQQQPEVKLGDNDLKWQAQNPWFGRDDEMTALAYAVHKKLVEKGFPAGSSEYYERVDARMREVFPDFFGETKKETREVKRPATVVAAPTRTAGKKTVVTLTKSQEAIARRLGLTNKQYATEVLKLNSES